jgi:hypothetical protein
MFYEINPSFIHNWVGFNLIITIHDKQSAIQLIFLIHSFTSVLFFYFAEIQFFIHI